MTIDTIEYVFGFIVIVAIVCVITYLFLICWVLKHNAEDFHPETHEAMEMGSINEEEAIEINNVCNNHEESDAQLALQN